jgi:predicted phosphodiesterase
MANVLIIGDTHAPCMLESYPKFLKEVKRKYKCTEVVHIGDLVDWSSISYHEIPSSLKNAEEEYEEAYKQVQMLYKAFPNCYWIIGNHDSLTQRQATTAGIPESALKSYQDMWGVPKWEVIPRYGNVIIDDVLYQHGDRGKGGLMSALKNAKDEYRSVVQGHLHAQAGVWYTANQKERNFGMQVGCGCDHHKEAQAYGKKYNQKPIIGCGVVQDGKIATFIPMEL